MRPPGSILRAHSANTSVSSCRYSTYELGTPSRSSSSSYCLPAKYGGDVTTSATDPSATSGTARASPQTKGSATGLGGTTSSASDTTGGWKRRYKPEASWLSLRPTPKLDVEVGRR